MCSWRCCAPTSCPGPCDHVPVEGGVNHLNYALAKVHCPCLCTITLHKQNKPPHPTGSRVVVCMHGWYRQAAHSPANRCACGHTSLSPLASPALPTYSSRHNLQAQSGQLYVGCYFKASLHTTVLHYHNRGSHEEPSHRQHPVAHVLFTDQRKSANKMQHALLLLIIRGWDRYPQDLCSTVNSHKAGQPHWLPCRLPCCWSPSARPGP